MEKDMGKIEIRDAMLEDAEAILDIYSYYIENTAITFEYDLPSIEEFRERISNTKKKYPYLVIVDNGKIMGYAYAGAFGVRAAYAWSAEISIYIAQNVRKCGYGRKLYEALEHELARMGILNLYACIAYPVVNDKYLTKNSAEFHAYLGFKQVGLFEKCGYKFGNWYHMIWMEKIIGEHGKNPNAVVAYFDLKFY